MINSCLFKFIFWVSVSLVFYTYFGYLALLLVLSLFFRKPVHKKDIIPEVTIIIAAHNEEDVIRSKIDNTLSLDYPAKNLEIIVVSDCSTDNTDSIVNEYLNRGVRLIRQKVRGGKTEAQNAAVREARGEIIFFSDASTSYSKDVLKKILRNFNDPRVGCVEGKLIFSDPESERIGLEKGLLTRIETWIRIIESKVGSVLGVSGCVYAVRKTLYKEMDKSLVSDLGISFVIVDQGFRVVFEKEAVVYEKPASSRKEEFKRNVRTVCQGWVATALLRKQILRMFDVFNFKFFAIQFISHKLLRWITPFLLLSVFISNSFIILSEKSSVYAVLFIIQICIYSAFLLDAILGYTMLNKNRIFQTVSYFLTYNVAAIMGLWKFISGEKKNSW